MRSPLLFIHSEDDHLAGIHNARQVRRSRVITTVIIIIMVMLLCLNAGFLFQMYETARSVQDPERVRMATFEGSHGYLHNGLYRDPRLPAIIK